VNRLLNPKTGRKPAKTKEPTFQTTEQVLKFYLIFLTIIKIYKLSGVNLIPPKTTLNDDQSSERLQILENMQAKAYL
jgi:hypothetical protein